MKAIDRPLPSHTYHLCTLVLRCHQPVVSSMSEPVVSFIILVRNDPMRLSMCLEAIKANELLPARAMKSSYATTALVDQTPTSHGTPARGSWTYRTSRSSELRNRGAQQAHGSILAFIDADNLIVDDWLKCVWRPSSTTLKQALRAANTNARTQARGSAQL